MRFPFSPADLNVALVDFCGCGLHLGFGVLPGSPDPREAAAAHFDRLAIAACRRRFSSNADDPESPRVTVDVRLLDRYVWNVSQEAVILASSAYLALWSHVRAAGQTAALKSEDHLMRRLATAMADRLLLDDRP
jgi:hypothetical protein